MTWRRGIAGTAVVAAIAFACSSFDEPPATPNDPDAGNGNDGGGSDGSGSDGGGNGEAGADGGGPCSRPPAPSGCTGILEQLDFASSEMPPVGWTEDSLDGKLARVADAGHCSPGFLRSTTTVPNEAGASAEAQITRTLLGNFKTAHVAFAFRGPTPVPDGYANIGCLVTLRPVASSTPRTQVRLTLSETTLTYGGNIRVDGGVVDTGPGLILDQTVNAASAAEWHTIDARFVITDNLVRVSTIYDGTALEEFSAALLALPGRADIECGINYSDEEGASYTLDLDDVFVELCP